MFCALVFWLCLERVIRRVGFYFKLKYKCNRTSSSWLYVWITGSTYVSVMDRNQTWRFFRTHRGEQVDCMYHHLFGIDVYHFLRALIAIVMRSSQMGLCGLLA